MTPKKVLAAVVLLSPQLISACVPSDPSGAGRAATSEVSATTSALVTATCGQTNDAPAIAGLIASGATEVLLPATTCNIGSAMTIANGVWVHGVGAATVLKVVSGGSFVSVFYGGANDFRVSDLTIDGNSRPVPAFNVAGNNVSISRLNIRNITTGAVYIIAGSGSYANIKLTDNVLQSVDTGIAVLGSPQPPTLSKISITNNAIKLNHAGGMAMWLRGVSDVIIDGNAATADNGTAIALESGVRSTIVANNVLQGAASPGAAVALGGGALDYNSDVQVNGNVMSGFARGVSVANTTNSRFSNVTVSNNAISNVTDTGVYLSDATDVVVSKNQVRDATYGVRVLTGVKGGVSRMVLTGNIIRGGAAACTGVQFNSSNLSDVIFASNTLVAGAGAFTPVSVATSPLGAFEIANNLGWKGAASGLHSGRNASGTVTKTCAAGTNCGTTIAVTFRDPASTLVPEPDMSYRVVVTAVGATGTVPAGARRVVAITKDPGAVAGTSNGFTINLEAALTAPAGGPSSVTYDWVVLRDPV
jgi:parallel beta-helix repeat protein